jgi:hypothetical protein
MAADPRIDAYIARAAPFAQPILAHLRDQVHAGCPAVEETLKWRMPFFSYKGKPLCGMAAFKAHCTFGFWNDEIVQLGRITALNDLPAPRALRGYVRAAARLVDEGVTRARPAKRQKPPLRMPADMKQALAGNAQATATFEQLPPSHKREYLEWILEAKTTPTRARRLATTVRWLVEGKHRNWKYDP